jgi:hypothetical protein
MLSLSYRVQNKHETLYVDGWITRVFSTKKESIYATNVHGFAEGENGI